MDSGNSTIPNSSIFYVRSRELSACDAQAGKGWTFPDSLLVESLVELPRQPGRDLITHRRILDRPDCINGLFS
jgi:hypothetical protein